MLAAFALTTPLAAPSAAAPSAAAQPSGNPNEYLYIANSTSAASSPYVSVANLNYDDVTGIANVDANPTAVAVKPDGTVAYSANTGADTVTVIDAATDEPRATVQVGQLPQGLAVTPDGNHVYVANTSSNTVSVIDTGTNRVTATVRDDVGEDPFGVATAVTPTGPRAYVTNGDGNVVVIDTSLTVPRVIATIPVSQDPQQVAFSADGSRAYVAGLNGAGTGAVSVIDTATNAVIRTLTLPGSTPYGVATGPSGSDVYVTDTENDAVLVIDPAGQAVTATVSVGDRPFGVVYSSDGNYVYVANFGDSTVSRIGAYLQEPEVVNTLDSSWIEGPVGLAAGPIPASLGDTDLRLKVTKEGKGPRGAVNPDRITLRAELTANGRPLRNKVVTFTSSTAGSAALCTPLTDRRGRVTCHDRYPHTGRICYTATFNGAGGYAPATATTCRRIPEVR
ncbi:beta-propeller fold lactonase family protein [Streptomyces sp. WAC06614]|uniref:beta-propeller fold lactonase family protein n=1 Tax=Streptomyces sp. WAC06614 TaxID=2487416 RepID=UPI00163B7D89|nr:YncE family protein [Streptomyces sp. WAC06614]